MKQASKRIIVALDQPDSEPAFELIQALGNRPFAYKAHVLTDREGYDVVARMKEAGAYLVFVDLKVHDIPSVAKARVQEWLRHGAAVITAHCAGGLEMLQAVCEPGIPILGVTVLTSQDENDLEEFKRPLQEIIEIRAKRAAAAGCWGVVCSPLEVEQLRSVPELDNLRLITPGIRMSGQSHDDQARVNTPAGAIAAGADYLVIGSAITKADDPVAAFNLISTEIESAMES